MGGEHFQILVDNSDVLKMIITGIVIDVKLERATFGKKFRQMSYSDRFLSFL